MLRKKWLGIAAGALMVAALAFGFQAWRRTQVEPWPADLRATIERVCKESFQAAADVNFKTIDPVIYCQCLTNFLAKGSSVDITALKAVKNNDQFHSLFSDLLNGPDGSEAKLDCFEKAHISGRNP